MEFLAQLEATALASWVRESPTVWAYPTVLFLHTVGLGFLVGGNVTIDLRLLGVARALPLAPLERLFPYMWAGFWVNALSGALLLVADATTKLTNPVFTIKMLLVGIGVINMAWWKRRLLRRASLAGDAAAPAGAGTVAVTSLLLWIGATVTGRLMGYLGPVSGLE
jgi:hypothetical protein